MRNIGVRVTPSRKRYEAHLKAKAEREEAIQKEAARQLAVDSKKLLGRRLTRIAWGPSDDGGLQITELVFEDGSRLKIWPDGGEAGEFWVKAKVIPPER